MTPFRRSFSLAASPGSAATGRRRIVEQVPAFAVVGLMGYVVDAGITYAGARYIGLSPEFARPPGFIVATIVNFLLNRAITFHGSGAPFWRAFARYWLVASAGLAVNYAVYLVCVQLAPVFRIPVTPAILPLFIGAGAGVAMVVTFFGFRLFAFR
jgi:putative flippase GtrA